jgi:EAL domain-containing protein (putative c-di-GMP-specific phosphodiesterase class I)
MQCDLGQGYLFAKPLSGTELEMLLSGGIGDAQGA